MPQPKKSENGNWPYRFEVLPLKQIIVDKYQRPLTSFVHKIAKDYDPALVGTIVVSERSKTKYAAMDGQTRVAGMLEAGETHGPCLVYEGLTVEQEAALFAKFQTQRRGMTSSSRFHAEVIAQVPEAVAIYDAIKEVGFDVGTDATEPNQIRAIAAVEFVYWGATQGKHRKVAHPELVARTLLVIRQAWPKLPDGAKSAVMIRGMGFFLASNDDVDDDKLVTRLQKVQPSELAKRAEALREGRGMSGNSPSYMAEAIESQYRRRGN